MDAVLILDLVENVASGEISLKDAELVEHTLADLRKQVKEDVFGGLSGSFDDFLFLAILVEGF